MGNFSRFIAEAPKLKRAKLPKGEPIAPQAGIANQNGLGQNAQVKEDVAAGYSKAKEHLSNKSKYPMTYVKMHMDPGKERTVHHVEMHHTHVDVDPKESRHNEHLVKSVGQSAKHKELAGKGYSIHAYGGHVAPKDYYTHPVHVTEEAVDEARIPSKAEQEANIKSHEKYAKDKGTPGKSYHASGFTDTDPAMNKHTLKTKIKEDLTDAQAIRLATAEKIPVKPKANTGWSFKDDKKKEKKGDDARYPGNWGRYREEAEVSEAEHYAKVVSGASAKARARLATLKKMSARDQHADDVANGKEKSKKSVNEEEDASVIVEAKKKAVDVSSPLTRDDLNHAWGAVDHHIDHFGLHKQKHWTDVRDKLYHHMNSFKDDVKEDLVVERKVDPADVDEPEGKEDDGTPEHLTMQMRKVVSLRGKKPVHFRDGKKHAMNPMTAHRFITKHDAMKPNEKEAFVNHAHKSLKHFHAAMAGEKE